MNLSIGWYSSNESSTVHGRNACLFSGSTLPVDNPECAGVAVGTLYIHKSGEESAEVYFKSAPDAWVSLSQQPAPAATPRKRAAK